MLTEFSVCDHWAGAFDEAGMVSWLAGLRRSLQAPEVTIGLVFITPALFPQAEEILELVRVHAHVPLLAGCSSQSLIAGQSELDKDPAVAVGLYYLPGGKLVETSFHQEDVEKSPHPDYWIEKTGVPKEESKGWLVFADPFHMDADRWLSSWNEAYPGVPVVGGLSSGRSNEANTQVYLNGEVLKEGGVAVNFSGQIALDSVISQGCTPIGETWTITRVEENLIHEIANRPAYEVLLETFNNLSSDEQQKTRGNLLVGLVTDEYREEFHRGDFLIRNLIGAAPQSGSLAVGAFPRQGQTIQFQRRDADAATEDMVALLDRAKGRLAGRKMYGGCLCCCNGRGTHLFGYPDHDSSLIQQRLGPVGLSGFFCNGEIGPIGDRNFLHGYTASLALFVSDPLEKANTPPAFSTEKSA